MRLPPGATIRAGTTGDAPFIQRVHEESTRGLGPGAYSRAEVESWAAGLQPDRYAWGMTHGGVVYFVAEVPGTGVIGFCCYVAGEVLALYILPEWTSRGIGSADRNAPFTMAEAGETGSPTWPGASGRAETG